MLSERIKLLREDVTETRTSFHGSWVKNSNPWARDIALANVLNRNTEYSKVQLRAELLKELVRVSKIDIYPNWSLAGEHLEGHHFGATLPEENFSKEDFKGNNLSTETIFTFKKNFKLFSNHHYTDIGIKDFDEYTESENNKGRAVYYAGGWIESHSVRDYGKLIKLGFGGIRKEVEQIFENSQIDEPNYVETSNFRKAVIAVCDAGILLGEKYAKLANDMASKTDNILEKERLYDMRDRCLRVPKNGANSFIDAVQTLWFGHILTGGEDGINANSIGRMDQFLYPYYKKDIKSGELTREKAVEIMEEFACKMYLDYDVQAITLSGRDEKGNDKTNELTYIILEATENLGFIRDVSLRVHKNTPEKLIKVAAKMLSKGSGIPFFFNDDCFIKALNDHGIALKDAVEYAIIGCIELTIPGKTNPRPVSCWFNSGKCLELVLFNGVDPVSNKQIGPKTGEFENFNSFEEFWEAYNIQVKYFAKRMVYISNRGELIQKENGPLPFLSTLTDDCIKRGKDITNNGAIYNYHSCAFLGTANTADSMQAIKKLIFEEEKLDKQTLLESLRNNFNNSENIRLMLLNQAEKYGNDSEEVDNLATKISNHFINIMDTKRSPSGGRYVVHLFSFTLNVDFGKGLGATPDGRKSGEPLAYSLSAHQGRDKESITAMLKSLAKHPHQRAAGASAAIIDIDGKMVQGETGITLLEEILHSSFKMGIGQLQLNVFTKEQLLKAKKDPEKYGNIPVRVAGFSMKFSLLSPELQDIVIARTKHDN